MGISVADNFSYLGGKPLDGRIQYATLAAMKAMADATLYEGCEAYCVETDKYYKWKSSNTVDADTGKWREVSSGGGQTYNDFTGATASTAGAHGLVPAPSAGDEGKVLFGNGAWGNIVMPSVDLSNSSVESDILDTTEKAVGTTTDGYLIYQKVVSTGGSIPSGATLLMRVQLLNSTDIIRYTKTTDSPLPSGVTFAGVTASGEVIYKREWTGLNLTINGNSWIDVSDVSTANMSKIIDCKVYSIGDIRYYGANTEFRGPNNTLRLFNNRGSILVVDAVTLYYTLAS